MDFVPRVGPCEVIFRHSDLLVCGVVFGMDTIEPAMGSMGIDVCAGGLGNMQYDDERMLNFISGMICGAAVGAAVALVMAPDSGKKTRKRIQRAAGDLRENATDRWDDAAEELRDRLDELIEGARKRIP